MVTKTSLQPWFDYFSMLQRYEECGFFELQADKHEAYVTVPALHAMSDGDDPKWQLQSGAIAETARRIRTYAAFRAQQGDGYLKQGFAVHVVQTDTPHDLLYTLFISRRRWPLHHLDRIEVIDYETRKKIPRLF